MVKIEDKREKLVVEIYDKIILLLKPYSKVDSYRALKRVEYKLLKLKTSS
jgi:hypothetical protein